MGSPVHSIPGKLTVTWEPEVRAIVDTWLTYGVSLEEFKTAVLVNGLEYGRMYGARAWVVDSSSAKGAFLPEIQAFIQSDVFPAFAKHGIKYFLTINSKSAITNLSIANYASKVGPAGIKLVEVPSAKDALEWLAHHPA